MTQPFESLRVSVPEAIYAELEDPATTDSKLALRGLSAHFGLKLPEYLDTGPNGVWDKVSDAMIADPTAITLPEKRPWLDNAKQVLALVQTYPWLRRVTSLHATRPLSFKIDDTEFFNLFLGHDVDDFPGLYGLTVIEAKELRAISQDQDVSKPEIAKEVGIYAQWGV